LYPARQKTERFHVLLPKTFLPFKSKVKNNGTLSTWRTETNYSALLDWQKRDLPFNLEKFEKQRNWALTQVRLLHGDVVVTTQFGWPPLSYLDTAIHWQHSSKFLVVHPHLCFAMSQISKHVARLLISSQTCWPAAPQKMANHIKQR
jgi:hypothetical protein